MLTTEQRDKWADALESGEYEQTHQILARGEALCCLGVLSKAVLGKTVVEGNFDDGYPDSDELDEDTQGEFISMNDEQNMSFAEIAKHVRQLPTSDNR